MKGLWVSPVEVEDALLSFPDVLEAAVVPGINEEGMNIVAAYVVLRSRRTVEEDTGESLKAHVRSHLPSYKCPSEIHFAKSLPRTATGKLQRFKLRDGA